MAIAKRAVIVVYSALVAALVPVLIAFSAVQIQQQTLRWRAEHLSADMHTIRLYQSTWADAQHLMHRWGAWGHYDGSCTAADCTYDIMLGSIAFYSPHLPRHAWLDWLLMHDQLNLYQRFGGRGSAAGASFTVHNGTIWRESEGIAVSIPRKKIRRDNNFDRTLSLEAEGYQRLHRTRESSFNFMGSEDELAQHPYYKVGRPGGCEPDCQMGVVYFSTHTPPAEIERLTSYNFSCFTRFSPCTAIEDLLPVAKQWHLYQQDEVNQTSLPPGPCDVPVWALARDARYVLSVEALSTTTERDQEGRAEEVVEVRVLESLKQPAPWIPGAVVSANLPGWLFSGSPSNKGVHLLPGRRYIVFPVGDDRTDQMVTKDSPLRFERCGLQEDTREIRHKLEKGFAQNDTLRP